jgi:hypothetical protein
MTDDRCNCESVCQVSLQCHVVVDDEISLELGGEQMYLSECLTYLSKARWQLMTDDRCTCESACQVCLQCDVVVDDEIVLELGRE